MNEEAENWGVDLLISMTTLALRVLRALAVALGILIVGIVIAASAVIAALATLIGWILRTLGDLVHRLLPWLPLAARWLARLFCAAVAVMGIAWSLPQLWLAYGHDLAASIPAAIIGLAPLLIALNLIIRPQTPDAAIDADRIWPALLAAGLASMAVTGLILALSPALRIVLLAILLAALITRLHLSPTITLPTPKDTHHEHQNSF